MAAMICSVCSRTMKPIGSRPGKLDPSANYYLHYCSDCHFTCLENPNTDYHSIYDEHYYRGQGADPLIDYVYEIEQFDMTIRQSEWAGMVKIFDQFGFKPREAWLDYGCGVGGLVRYAANRHYNIKGYDIGWGADFARKNAIPLVDTAEMQSRRYQFISAIEVLEHVTDPLEHIRTIYDLLEDGGVFFFTTGNARPWRNKILDWSYTSCPEVHVSFYEPKTMEKLLSLCGFKIKYIHDYTGFKDIIRYKILKNFKIKTNHWLLKLLPWPIMISLAKWRYGVNQFPVGIK
jgi:SAM-dependent methyltransferase